MKFEEKQKKYKEKNEKHLKENNMRKVWRGVDLMSRYKSNRLAIKYRLLSMSMTQTNFTTGLVDMILANASII